MQAKHRNSAALVTLALIGSASSDIIYSNLQDTAIPTGTWAGVTVSVNDGTINPFFGGAGVANDALFQPARVGTDQLDTIVNLAVGTTISSSNGTLHFSFGAGGSQDHLGTTFTAGTEGYIGFNSNGNYGWMRVVFTNNTANAVIKDWAYDSSGAGIATGNILQSAVPDSAQAVTLNSAAGSFTLGSQITDSGVNGVNVNSVVKIGAGTTTLTGANTYTGNTTVQAGTLKLGSSGVASSTKIMVGDSLAHNGAVLEVTGLTSGFQVVSGQILAGHGKVTGAVTVNSGGTQTAGDAVTVANSSGAGTIGKATFDTGITYNQGSIFEWNLSANNATSTGTRGINYDAVNTASMATTGDKAIFQVVLNGGQDFSESFWDMTRTWDDIFKTADGGTALSLDSIFGSVQSTNAGGSSVSTTGYGSFSMSGSTLTWTAVPEPSTALAGLLLGAGLLRRKRA